MKNLLKCVFIIFFMFAFISIQAQIKFGAKVGLNLSTMTMKSSGISLDPKILAGFNIGLISEIPVAGNFKLQPGILYSTKGSKYKIMDTEVSIGPDFVEIPVNILYKIDLSGAKLSLFAGPYFAYAVGGKTKSGGQSADIKFGSGQNDDMKPFDLGLNIGAGIGIKNIMLSIQYGFGLTNLAPVTTNDTEMKIKVIGISVAYLF
jgi:hypothetical protein